MLPEQAACVLSPEVVTDTLYTPGVLYVYVSTPGVVPAPIPGTFDCVVTPLVTTVQKYRSPDGFEFTVHVTDAPVVTVKLFELVCPPDAMVILHVAAVVGGGGGRGQPAVVKVIVNVFNTLPSAAFVK